MASQDGQTKTNTENTGAESVKELEQNQSPYVTDIDDTTEDGELVCKKQKLADVTQGDDVNPGEAENKKEENKEFEPDQSSKVTDVGEDKADPTPDKSTKKNQMH